MAGKEPRQPSEEEFQLMNALQAKLTERQIARMANPNVTKMYTRRMIEDAFLETFELIGGLPRLAIWANESGNYETFLNLLMKFAPKERVGPQGGKTIEYRSIVPPSALNAQTKKPENKPKVDEDVIDVDP